MRKIDKFVNMEIWAGTTHYPHKRRWKWWHRWNCTSCWWAEQKSQMLTSDIEFAPLLDKD